MKRDLSKGRSLSARAGAPPANATSTRAFACCQIPQPEDASVVSSERGLTHSFSRLSPSAEVGPAGAPFETALVQRKVNFAGSKGAIKVPAYATGTAKRIQTLWAQIRPGGAKHIANVQGRGLMGYSTKRGEWVGGEPFNNDPMPDGQRLPVTSYTEWDVRPAVVGTGRGQERVVRSNGGVFYYTNDHYDNFTEFTP
jgi:hypothetical protein